MMVMKRPSLRQFSWLLGGSLLLGALFWLWLAVQQQEATLAIRPVGQWYRNAGRFLRLASSRCQRHPL